jgi:hypothetical protein
VVSGDTGLPVANAQVLADGARGRTDAQGRLALEAGTASALDVVAEGYLSRQTRMGDGRVTLWPVGPGHDADYVRAIIYRSSAAGGAKGSGPEQPLERLAATRAVLLPSRELVRDAEAMAALRESVALLNEVTAGSVTFSVGGPTAGAAVFVLEVDPALKWIAATYKDVRGGGIAGGRIAFATLAAARRAPVAAHELGHVLGLQHSASRQDLMFFEAHDGAASFTAEERLTIRLLLQRLPGNRYPDNDRDSGATAAAVSLCTG